MTTGIEKLLEGYHAWVRENSVLAPAAHGWTEITTPSLDRHNDHLQMYVKKEGNEILFSDDGYILADFEQSGCSLDSPKRQELLGVTLRGFNVERHGDELRSRADERTFARRKHEFLQAMVAVNDMFVLAAPTVKSLFLEDVAE